MITTGKVYDIKNTTPDDIGEMIDQWSSDTFGEVFQFRENQKEAILKIICDWLYKTNNTVICSAPTGSGKSIIAIIVAGVLSTYFNLRGYILISDLSLLEQYEKDLTIYCPEWAIIKGQTNYTCALNGRPFTIGKCKMDGVKTYGEIEESYSDCSPYCEYIIQRRKAITSKVLVCTYAYWLMIQNNKNEIFSDSLYDERYFTIADEAHKVVEIVQSHFSPRISDNDTTKFNFIYKYVKSDDIESLKTTIDTTFASILCTNDKTELYNQLKHYTSAIIKLSELAEQQMCIIRKSSFSSNIKFQYLNNVNWLNDVATRFTNYMNIIGKIGSNLMVKTSTQHGCIFNCLDDSYLMTSKFIKNCTNMLFMSATLGNIDSYAKSIMVEQYDSIIIPSTFDYTKSPIFYVEGYKMSYKEKETSYGPIMRMIAKILNMYNDKRGIIQTGSYDLAEKIYNTLQPIFGDRLLVYKDAETKRDQLDTYKYSDNLVLIGPTLVEGISLDDDLARFLIIAKVPYASLNDNYTAEKMKYDPKWYTDQACKNLLQGIGRGVRSKTDWCVNFILDGCFSSIISNSLYMFPAEFINRIQIIPASILLQ